MKSLIALSALILLFSATTKAITCEELLKNEDTVRDATSGEFTDYANWFNYDVLVSFDRAACEDVHGVGQTYFDINGETLVKTYTNEDSCDGGNTYGLIQDEAGKVIAHIYDGDLYCEKDWGAENLTANYKCNAQAEKIAEQKMADFGLSFKAMNSNIELRAPYYFDFINVEGEVNGANASVQVLVDIDTCTFSGASIRYLAL